jgi:predicted permease
MPLFIILSVGFFLRRIGLIDNNAVLRMNAVVFNAALPVMLFRDIAVSNFMKHFDLNLIIFSVMTTLMIFFLLFVITLFRIKDRKKAGAFIQGSFRGNYAIIAIPLAYNILGGPSGMAILIAAFTVPLYNVLSIIALSYGGADTTDKKAVIGAVKHIIRNPLIIGIVAGVPFSVFEIEFPTFLRGSMNYMANLTTPLALLSIGATLTSENILAGFKNALSASALKLVIMPVIFLSVAYLFGFRGEAFVILFAMYSVPTAVSSYIMADIMKCDSRLAANIVMVTTFLSVFTLTAGIYIIKALGIC